ncbi:UbiA family prenyltransferase [Knoellia sp. 3-2P3]|uniref:UbiA family prenyltransferase n=1 Tax=unclassified Knoellia TaxID=2618719 RepID=UPI0023D9EA86|nr:UbiA family prenyltransferase [Knoellia sp. 3-2P3]MDF2092160.1 UbiA family prenyltransferase [Knoellia sp. 3-2P3]
MRRLLPGLPPVLPSLARACHPGPTVAVTTLTALLAAGSGHGLGTGALVTAAVGTGQLTIGWSNDLVDAGRDRVVGRLDKPVARGEVPEAVVRLAVGVAGFLCVALSLACGAASAAVHLLLGVASGWAYNLGLKRTAWSAVPYAVAFGALPAVVTLALPDPGWPAPWVVVAGALLGVGAHLLNALPDLADDEQTGVRGLPHRLGAQVVRRLAPTVLTVASAVALIGPPGRPSPWAWAVFALCLLLAAVAVVGRGRTPFGAAVGIAALDVAALVTGA